MNFRYRITSPDLVVITYSTPVMFARWVATMDEILADPSYRPGCVFLGDRRALAEAPTRAYAEAVVNYLSTHRRQLEGARWADLVAPGNAAAFGMGRMIAILAELEGVVEIQSFTDEAAALAWLTGT